MPTSVLQRPLVHGHDALPSIVHLKVDKKILLNAPNVFYLDIPEMRSFTAYLKREETNGLFIRVCQAPMYFDPDLITCGL